MTEYDFEQFNRDVIRKAASAAGVSNVSYKSKVENIEAMKALGVIALDGGEDPVFASDAVAKSLGAIGALIDEVAALDDEVHDSPVPDEVYDDQAPSHGDLEDDFPTTLEGAQDLASSGGECYIVSDSQGFFSTRWFRTEEEASRYIETLPGYQSGRYSLDGPAEGEVGWEDDVEVPQDSAAPRYNLSMRTDGRSVVTFVHGGDLVSISDDHDAYVRVLEALLSGADPSEWLDESAQVQAIIENLSDRLQVVFPPSPTDDSKPTVLFDGEPIHGRMVDVFLRYHLEGRDASNLVKFLERVAQNPVPGASQRLFDWAGGERLTIDPDGYFIGFKSLLPTDEPGVFKPGHSGPGEVNGVAPVDGMLRQKVGDHVTIDPALVRPGDECGVGLHVGSWYYASTFHGANGVVTEVRVDPADVVNVPRSETGKLRAVHYEVVAIHDRNGDARHLEPPAIPEENIEVVLEEAEVPKSFWQRVLRRRSRA